MTNHTSLDHLGKVLTAVDPQNDTAADALTPIELALRDAIRNDDYSSGLPLPSGTARKRRVLPLVIPALLAAAAVSAVFVFAPRQSATPPALTPTTPTESVSPVVEASKPPLPQQTDIDPAAGNTTPPGVLNFSGHSEAHGGVGPGEVRLGVPNAEVIEYQTMYLRFACVGDASVTLDVDNAAPVPAGLRTTCDLTPNTMTFEIADALEPRIVVHIDKGVRWAMSATYSSAPFGSSDTPPVEPGLEVECQQLALETEGLAITEINAAPFAWFADHFQTSLQYLASDIAAHGGEVAEAVRAEVALAARMCGDINGVRFAAPASWDGDYSAYDDVPTLDIQHVPSVIAREDIAIEAEVVTVPERGSMLVNGSSAGAVTPVTVRVLQMLRGEVDAAPGDELTLYLPGGTVSMQQVFDANELSGHTEVNDSLGLTNMTQGEREATTETYHPDAAVKAGETYVFSLRQLDGRLHLPWAFGLFQAQGDGTYTNPMTTNAYTLDELLGK